MTRLGQVIFSVCWVAAWMGIYVVLTMVLK